MGQDDWRRLFALHAERPIDDGPRDYEFYQFRFDHPKGTVLEHRGL